MDNARWSPVGPVTSSPVWKMLKIRVHFRNEISGILKSACCNVSFFWFKGFERTSQCPPPYILLFDPCHMETMTNIVTYFLFHFCRLVVGASCILLTSCFPSTPLFYLAVTSSWFTQHISYISYKLPLPLPAGNSNPFYCGKSMDVF